MREWIHLGLSRENELLLSYFFINCIAVGKVLNKYKEGFFLKKANSF